MAVVIYIHGFLSSPQSLKAQQTHSWLQQQRPDIQFICPELPSYPEPTAELLREVITPYAAEEIYLIGSSLGGYWATYLIETQRAAKAVLVNPGVSPQRLFAGLIGKTLTSYYSEEQIQLSEYDRQQFENFDREQITRPEKYFLMVQTGDETLDYRHAVEKYSACKQWVESGGNHAFVNYQMRLPEIMAFFAI